MFTQKFTLHRMPQQGETRDDVLALVLSVVHAPQIEAQRYRVTRRTTGDFITVTLDGFANRAEIQDHLQRFRALGAHATVDPK